MNRLVAALMCTLLSLSACGGTGNSVGPQPSVAASDDAPRSTEQNQAIGTSSAPPASNVADTSGTPSTNDVTDTSDIPPPSDDNG